MNSPPISYTPAGPKGFLEGVWNPEDLVALPGSPWIVVSAMRCHDRPGALLAARCDRSEAAMELQWSEQAEGARLGRDMFDPHGIAVRALGDGACELLVIDHGGGEAVDRLRIDVRGDTPVISDGERIAQPPGTSGNALAHMPDGGFVLTSMFDPRDPDTLSKFAKAEVTGGIWRWSDDGGWRRFGTLGLSGANGIAVAADGSAVFVSEWSARRVWRLGPDGEPAGHLDTGFLPDNLRWTSRGELLLAGQRARPEKVFGCVARGERCPLAFEVVAIDPETLTLVSQMAVSERLAETWGFGGATGALQVGDELWVGSFTGERIAKFQYRAHDGIF
jgi:sugar lactone lactonase YvrE